VGDEDVLRLGRSHERQYDRPLRMCGITPDWPSLPLHLHTVVHRNRQVRCEDCGGQQQGDKPFRGR
jgi:hypothetical protein